MIFDPCQTGKLLSFRAHLPLQMHCHSTRRTFLSARSGKNQRVTSCLVGEKWSTSTWWKKTKTWGYHEYHGDMMDTMNRMDIYIYTYIHITSYYTWLWMGYIYIYTGDTMVILTTYHSVWSSLLIIVWTHPEERSNWGSWPIHDSNKRMWFGISLLVSCLFDFCQWKNLVFDEIPEAVLRIFDSRDENPGLLAGFLAFQCQKGCFNLP